MFKFEENKNYSMPVFFGADDYSPDATATVDEIISLSFSQQTEGEVLKQWLPEGFTLLRPEIKIGYCQMRGIPFINGGGYNIVEVSVPARFDGEFDHIEGNLALVVWENNAYPITGGREDCGIPKIYAQIPDLCRSEDKWYTSASVRGNTFLTLDASNPQAVSQQELEQMATSAKVNNEIGYRYFRKIGEPGYELCQPVLYPQSMVMKGAWRCTGMAKWNPLDMNKYYFGYKILEALSSLPIKSTTVSMSVGSLNMKPNTARVLK